MADFSEGQGGQRKIMTPQTETHDSQREADTGSQQSANKHSEPWGKPIVKKKQRGCIGSNTEKCIVAQRNHPGVSRENVPRAGKGAPQEDQNETIKIKVIFNKQRSNAQGQKDY